MNTHHFDSLINKSKVYRKQILDIVYKTGKGHIGGAYSILDILVYMYYGGLLHTPYDADSDIVLIGKGHACISSYVIWADLGIIDKSLIEKFGYNGAILGSQFDTNIPHSLYNSGSLGHVLGISAGYALALKLMKNDNKMVFTIIGDGECEEGSIWESIDFAVKRKLDNLIVIVDRNRLSVTDFIEDDNLVQKFNGFGANVIEINGHDFDSICDGFFNALSEKNKVSVIIANTIKGKGVSFLENNAKWHQSTMKEEEYNIARKELE